MENILEQVGVLINRIKTSKDYIRFHELNDQLKMDEPLYKRINEFRKQSYFIQNGADQSNLFSQIEELQTRYYDVINHSLVYEYLALERGLNATFRQIFMQISDEIELDLSFLN